LLLKVYFQYSIPVFIAGMGILQAAGAYNNLKGLLFFRRKFLAYLFSAITILPPLIYLFTWNYHSMTGIIEGSQQAGLFFLAMVLALILTLAISSLVNRAVKPVLKTSDGLETLRDTTFVKIIQNWFNR
jgi:hypothetical protein